MPHETGSFGTGHYGTSQFGGAGPLVQSNPVLYSVTPTEGKAGDVLTVRGVNFSPTDSYLVDGVSVVSSTYVSGIYWQITVPGGVSVGLVDIVVIASGGSWTHTLEDAFEVVAAPTFSGIAASTGSTNGSTAVTITGTGFRNGMSITVGGLALTGLTVVDQFTATGSTQAHTAGAVDVVVTTIGGSATGVGAFTYVSPPAVTGINPTYGPLSGQALVLTGTDFTADTQITIGGIAALNVTYVGPTQMTCTIPALAAGVRAVQASNPYGSNGSTQNYTAYAVPTITNITPPRANREDPRPFSIEGTGFVDGLTTVTLCGLTPTGLSIAPTLITGTTPLAGSNLVGDVVVTTPGGTATDEDAFEFYTAGPGIGAVQVVDVRTIVIRFTKVPVEADALVEENYSISGPTVVAVERVEKVTDWVYRLVTTAQMVGGSYTAAISGIRDSDGNLPDDSH